MHRAGFSLSHQTNGTIQLWPSRPCVSTALYLTMKQEEVNISLPLWKVCSAKGSNLLSFSLSSLFSLAHKRAFQRPDVMKIENREQNQGIVGEHKGGGRSIRDDGNETTPGEVIYRLSVSHQPPMWQAWTLPWCTVKTVHLYIPRHSLYSWYQTNFHQVFYQKTRMWRLTHLINNSFGRLYLSFHSRWNGTMGSASCLANSRYYHCLCTSSETL